MIEISNEQKSLSTLFDEKMYPGIELSDIHLDQSAIRPSNPSLILDTASYEGSMLTTPFPSSCQ